MKTIVIGLGNPILGDDGIGWKVAEEVKKRLTSLRLQRSSSTRGGDEEYIDVEFLSLGGISLMESLIGYDRAILIDAIASDHEPGSVVLSKLSELPDYSAFHTTSTHDTSLQNALKLGKRLGAKLPDEVMVVGIATQHTYDFGEQLTPPVAAAIPQATKFVIDLLVR
ncbi:MAG TPA: hydrogenase maturation protease [Anaerolineales bacterium]|nr:hydrogenase maturation protease [Anaerolineales bacterium]